MATAWETNNGDQWNNTSAPADDPWHTIDDSIGNNGASGGHDQWNDGGGDQTGSGNYGDNGDGGGNDYGNSRGCFNCGEEGHNKADCTKPRVFTGTCNLCGKDGHMRKDCPDKPPETCRLCGEEGHIMSQCKNPRKIDRSNIKDVDPETAWRLLTTAISERDLDDVKDAVAKYLKHYPDMTYMDLHNAFRSQDLKLWLVPLERELLHTYTNMDLQGNVGKKYTISYRFNDRPDRPREVASWPSSEEELEERLKDAGEPVDSGVRKCGNCGEVGHFLKECPLKRMERDRVTVMCINCSEVGHRVRDCPAPRVDRFACKNCSQSGHRAAECTEPRSAEGVECRKCNEMGHFSKDCPTAPQGPRGCRNCGQEGHIARDCTEPVNMDNVQCRNCDEHGHFSKECPKPRDWSRVTCSQCGKNGHTKVRCKEPPKLDDDFDAQGENYSEGAWAAPDRQGEDDAWGNGDGGGGDDDGGW